MSVEQTISIGPPVDESIPRTRHRAFGCDVPFGQVALLLSGESF